MSNPYRSSPKICVKTVHGGLILSMTDTLGSLALATKGSYMTGVSVDIGTSFLKPAGRVGDILKARATVTGLGKSTMHDAYLIPNPMPFSSHLKGKTLAFTKVDFMNEAGDLVAYGRKSDSISPCSTIA